MPVELPIFLNKRNKNAYCIVSVLLGGTFYLLSNHFLFFPAHLLTLTWLDRTIPFLPGTVWIYNSDMFLFIFAYLMSKEVKFANKYLYSFFTMLVFSVSVFLLWPTTYPRDLYPLPATLDPWTTMMFSSLRGVDTPSNCLPSLHVSMSYLSAFIFLDEQKNKFPFFLTWATLVALSTLTTKQHYVADVVTGFLLAMAIYFIFTRWVRYTVPEQS